MNIQRAAESRINTIDFQNIGFGQHISDHTFDVVFNNGAWGEGRIKPYGAMHHGLGLHALHYGQAVFEGMRRTAKTTVTWPCFVRTPTGLG